MFQVNEVLEVEDKCYRILDAYVTEFIWFELHNPKALPTVGSPGTIEKAH